ncbi:MAG: aldo/keto reductase [Spirochaetales bacterium]|nr:aldo/keto reductase [Spirochaetales bacterium]
MDRVTLGKTGITVCRNGFGALPIQRIGKEDAAYLVRKAYENGVNFFDTARAYTDSEEKLGYATSSFRDKIYIATKTAAKNGEDLKKDLETSLSLLKTDYIDIYQFHNPPFCPKPGDGTGLYEAMLEAKKEGKIRHIGITNHRLGVAKEAIESGLYETLQFPFSYISGEKEMELLAMCREKEMGFIAMKGLAGGLLNNSRVCYAFMSQFDNVLPIWGVQRERELDEWLSYNDNPPVMDEEVKSIIEKDRKELSGDFCRGCGYCMPCPMGIQISECARMIQMIRRSPSEGQLGTDAKAMMANIHNCVKCGKCMDKCPYSLPIPTLLEKNLEDYEAIIEGRIEVAITKDARN